MISGCLPRNRYCSLSQSTSAIIPHSIQRKENRRCPSHVSTTVKSNGMTSCLAISTAAWTTNFSIDSITGCLHSDTVWSESLQIGRHRTCYDVAHWWWRHCLTHPADVQWVDEEPLANRLYSLDHWSPEREHTRVKSEREDHRCCYLVDESIAWG